MSQVHVPSSSVPDVLQLQMIANGASTNSGSAYDLVVGDDSVFQTNITRGSTITLDSGNTTKLNLKAGLYQITFAGRTQTANEGYGEVDYQLFISTDPTFALRNVLADRAILWYGNGSSANTRPVIDQNHTVLFNTGVDTTVYIRIQINNDFASAYNLIGSVTDKWTTLDVVRLSEAVS